jgi:hypothetical protein
MVILAPLNSNKGIDALTRLLDACLATARHNGIYVVRSPDVSFVG